MNLDMPGSSTLTIHDASAQTWDIIVVGAGPAGSVAALEAARRGLRVLLVDRQRFPRSKVCGCCINRAALQVLRDAGLDDVVASLPSIVVKRYQIACQGRTASISMPGGMVVSREQFDARLVEAAVEHGAQFLDGVGILPDFNDADQWLMKQGERVAVAHAQVAIVASGLGSRLSKEQCRARVSALSRVGLGTTIASETSDFEAGSIYMACSERGYVGVVRLVDGRLNVAVALDRSVCESLNKIGGQVNTIIHDSGLPRVDGLEKAKWQGTPQLTQRPSRLFGERYLCVGDAAGYVEPFTGEGIAWALATGRMVVPFAIQATSQQMDCVGPCWTREYRRMVGGRLALCRSISRLVRRPRLVATTVGLLARCPQLAIPLERIVNMPFRYDLRR